MSAFSWTPFSCQTQSWAQCTAGAVPQARSLCGRRGRADPGHLLGASSTQWEVLLRSNMCFPDEAGLLQLCSQPLHPAIAAGAAPAFRASSSHQGRWPSTFGCHPIWWTHKRGPAAIAPPEKGKGDSGAERRLLRYLAEAEGSSLL